MDPSKDKYPPISALSKHLFWDTPQEKVSWERNGPWLVARIMDYGFESDWKLLKEAYGLQGIGEIAIKVRYLQPKSLSFLSLILDIPKEEFRCYKLMSLNQGHWIY